MANGIGNTAGLFQNAINTTQQSFAQTQAMQNAISGLSDQMNAAQMTQQVNQMAKSHALKTLSDELNNMQSNQQLLFGIKSEYN